MTDPNTTRIIADIENWQRNRMTTYTPSNILHDFGDQIIAALRTAASESVIDSGIPTFAEMHAVVTAAREKKLAELVMAENCARLAFAHVGEGDRSRGRRVGYDSACRDIANAIRDTYGVDVDAATGTADDQMMFAVGGDGTFDENDEGSANE